MLRYKKKQKREASTIFFSETQFTFSALAMWKVPPDHAEPQLLQFSMCSPGDKEPPLIFAANRVQTNFFSVFLFFFLDLGCGASMNPVLLRFTSHSVTLLQIQYCLFFNVRQITTPLVPPPLFSPIRRPAGRG